MLGYVRTLSRGLLGKMSRFWEAETSSGGERRQWMRHPSHARTVFRPIAGADNLARPAQVRNVSFGGINLVVDLPVGRGELLHVELPEAGDSEPSLLACVVQAGTPVGSAWSLGCSFIRELSEGELRRFICQP